VLEILAAQYGAVRGLISLVDGNGEVRVEAADGIAEASRPVRYQPGEGITGQVVESGKAIVVPRVSREPGMLHRAARRPELAHQELSFICVPILLNKRGVGALAIDLNFSPERTFNRSVKFLGIVSMRTPSCARSCANATTSRTLWAAAARCARSTSRLRRWLVRTRRSSFAANRGPARS